MNDEGIDQLIEDEGFSATPYPDGRSGLAIGHGINQRSHPEIYNKYGKNVTREQARLQVIAVCEKHAKDFARRLSSDDWNNLNQRQRNNLLSTAYNAGVKATCDKVRDAIVNKDWNAVAQGLREVSTSGWVRDQKIDLSSRREVEARGFLEASPTNTTARQIGIRGDNAFLGATVGGALGATVGGGATVVTGNVALTVAAVASPTPGVSCITVSLALVNPPLAAAYVCGAVLAVAVVAGVGTAVAPEVLALLSRARTKEPEKGDKVTEAGKGA